jgi:hypothetical protein
LKGVSQVSIKELLVALMVSVLFALAVVQYQEYRQLQAEYQLDVLEGEQE